MTVFVALHIGFRMVQDSHVISLPWLLLAWVVVLAALLAIGRTWVTPALARTTPTHARITRSERWSSPLPPEAALDVIARSVSAAVPTDGVRSAREPGELRLAWGSDETYRIKGAASEEGWAALPIAAQFTAVADGPGSRLTAEVRDDLGWYSAEPAPFVENEVHRRGGDVLRRARAATENPATDG
ncbi:hypothetical protein [Kocuria rhizophila]|uniref:hypothetical protein n=1 Tax=Kocuria rhizophila TaxID=72000 RepID=UPI0038796EE9